MKYAWVIILLLTYLGCNNKSASTVENYEEIDGLYSLIVQKEGEIIKEYYREGHSDTTLCNVQSVTKSIMSLLIGVAIDQKLLEDVSIKVFDILPEIFVNVTDAQKKEITILDLLNQTTGLEWDGYKEHEAWLTSTDQSTYVLGKTLRHTPGGVYNYNSGATHILSLILSHISGTPTLDFAQQFLFSPLGIDHVNWTIRNDGYHDGSGLGLEMKPEALVKIGQLLNDRGRLGEEQLISAEWVDVITDPTLKNETKWGIRHSNHGYCWYHASVDNKDIHYAMGYGGQFIITVPSEDLVVVSNYNHDTPDGIGQQVGFLKIVLPDLMREDISN